MLAEILNRFRSRETAMSTVAQLALTWSAHVLTGTIDDLTTRLAEAEEQRTLAEEHLAYAMRQNGELRDLVTELELTIMEVAKHGDVSHQSVALIRQLVADGQRLSDDDDDQGAGDSEPRRPDPGPDTAGTHAPYPAADDLDPLGRGKPAPVEDATPGLLSDPYALRPLGAVVASSAATGVLR